MKILIVDDNSVEVQLETFIIQAGNSMTFEISHAAYLTKGLKLCEELKPDLLILDLNLPDSPTAQTIENIPNFKLNTRFIIVASGLDDDEIAQKAIKYGADKFIHKSSFSFANKEGIQKLINQLLSN